jgi:PhnB protein
MARDPLGLSTREHEGFHTVTPYLVVDDCNAAINFYKGAFGAVDLHHALVDPASGKAVHAEIRIGNSPIMLSDELPAAGTMSATSLKGSPVHLHMYVHDVDSVVRSAEAAGAKVLIPVADQFYGARGGRIQDPFGHIWIVETQKEDFMALPHPEKQRRTEDFLKQFKVA